MGATKKVGLFEAKTHLSALVEEARLGAEIEITRRGETVARLSAPGRRDTKDIHDAIEGLKRLSATQTLGGITIKELIEAGRKY